MKRLYALFGVIAFLANPVVLRADEGDGRLQLVHYVPHSATAVRMAPGTGVLILLATGEHIQTIHLSDPLAFQVNVSVVGDSLYLRQTRPRQHAAMSIQTDQRNYEFSLIASETPDAPYLVRFSYPDPAPDRAPVSSTLPAEGAELTGYKLRGNRVLRPQSITDDGKRTFIIWAADQPIPAVFALDRLGHEAMVDGYMRDGMFTIDRVHEKLVFRIDRAALIAKRQTRRKGR